jgi:hypothetical protein
MVGVAALHVEVNAGQSEPLLNVPPAGMVLECLLVMRQSISPLALLFQLRAVLQDLLELGFEGRRLGRRSKLRSGQRGHGGGQAERPGREQEKEGAKRSASSRTAWGHLSFHRAVAIQEVEATEGGQGRYGPSA